MTAAADAPQAARRGGTPGGIPFPGLDPFCEQDAPYFFGRDRDRKIIASNLEASRLTLLYGASGVGKSSVLLAGVVRDLRRRAIANVESRRGTTKPARFAVAVCRSWLEDPLPRLMELIRLSAEEALGGEELEPWQPPAPPVERLRAWTERVKFLYVVLDQFEEYFLYHSESDEALSFDAELARIVNDPRLRVHFLISLREDALALLDRFKAKIPRLYENYLRIDHLDLESAQQAIERPIEAYNKVHAGSPIIVEPELVDALLGADDLRSSRTLGADAPIGIAEAAGGKPRIETPYLQLILRRLWLTEEAEGSRRLRKQTLDKLGGPRQIVERHLEAAMDALTGTEQELAVDVFRYLVTPSKSKIAYTPSDLAEHVEKPADDVASLFEKLCEGNRILRRILAPAGDTSGVGGARARYEIFHDVLAEPIIAWRARKTAERKEHEEREAAERELQERLASQEREKHQALAEARKQRVRAFVAGALAVLAAGACALAAWQWSRARAERDNAQSQQWAAQAATDFVLDPLASVDQALRALGIRRTDAAERTLRTVFPQARVRAMLPSRDWATAATIGGPDRRYIAYGTRSGNVRLWDWRSRREAKRLLLPGWQNTTSFAAGGTLLLAAGNGAAVWDVPACLRGADDNCKPKYSWVGTQFYVQAAISPNGRWAVTSENKVAQLHDLTLTCPASCDVGPPRNAGRFINALAVDDHGLVAAAVQDGTLRVWRRAAAAGATTHVLAPGWSFADDVALSRDGFSLAAAGEKEMAVWHLRRCRTVRASPCRRVALVGHPDWVNKVAFSPDDNQVVTAAEDGIARVWEPGMPTPLLELRGHTDTVFDADFDPTGAYLVSASADGTVRVWDVGTGTVFRGNGRGLRASFSRDGRRIVTSDDDGTARIFDRSGKQLATLIVPAGPPPGDSQAPRRTPALGGAAFSPSGDTVVTSDHNGYLRTWNVAQCIRASVCENGHAFGDGPVPEGDLNEVELGSRGGATLAAVAGNWAGLRIVEVGGSTIARREQELQDRQTLAVAFSVDGDYVAVSTTKGVRVWKVSGCYAAPKSCKPTVARSFPRGAIVFDLAFSPDGLRLVTGGSDRIARVWKWREPDAVPVLLRGHAGSVRSVGFGASRRVVTSGVDGSIRVWDAESGDVLAVLAGHAAPVNSLEFAPKSSRLILSASEDGMARLSDCPRKWCGPLDDVRREAESLVATVHRAPKWLQGDAPASQR